MYLLYIYLAAQAAHQSAALCALRQRTRPRHGSLRMLSIRQRMHSIRQRIHSVRAASSYSPSAWSFAQRQYLHFWTSEVVLLYQ